MHGFNLNPGHDRKFGHVVTPEDEAGWKAQPPDNAEDAAPAAD